MGGVVRRRGKRGVYLFTSVAVCKCCSKLVPQHGVLWGCQVLDEFIYCKCVCACLCLVYKCVWSVCMCVCLSSGPCVPCVCVWTCVNGWVCVWTCVNGWMDVWIDRCVCGHV